MPKKSCKQGDKGASGEYITIAPRNRANRAHNCHKSGTTIAQCLIVEYIPPLAVLILRQIASNSKLKYISFYTNLLKEVKIDKDKRLSKGSFKFLKTLFSI